MLKKYSYIILSLVVFIILGYAFTNNSRAQVCSGDYTCGMTTASCQGNAAYPGFIGCPSVANCALDTVHCAITSICEQSTATTYACSGTNAFSCSDSARCGIGYCSGPSNISCVWSIPTPLPSPSPAPPPPTPKPTLQPGATPIPTPPSPGVIGPTSNLSCPANNPTSVTFAWTAVPNATQYYLRVDDTSNPWAGTCLAGGTPNPGDICGGYITSTTQTLSLPANKNYQWLVSAFNSDGTEGPNTGWIPFSIPAVCPCSVTTSPASLTLPWAGSGTIFASVASGLGTATVNNMAFGSYNTAITTVSPGLDSTSPYSTTATAVSAGSGAVWASAILSDGRVCGSTAATDTDITVTAPACTISLSPGTTNITLGGATGTITATVSCNTNIDNVSFSSSNTAAVTVSPTTVTPGAVTSATVITNATGVAVGSSIITGSVYAGGSATPVQSATAIVNAAPLSAWFQVKDADVTSGSDLSTHVQAPQVFGLAGAGGYPGIPVYQNVTDLTPPSKASSLSWIAKNTATNQRIYDYKTLTAQIPSDVVPNVLPATVTDANFNAAVGPYGYTWYKYSGAGLSDLTINGAISIGATEKVILLVDSANLLINAPITVADGGFFMVVVGETTTGTKGNITVATTVGGGAAPNLEGIYVADNVFSDSVGNLPLWIRGSVAGYGGVQLLRDLVAGNFSSPAELIEFAPDQILLYPSKLSARKLNWKEVAP